MKDAIKTILLILLIAMVFILGFAGKMRMDKIEKMQTEMITMQQDLAKKLNNVDQSIVSKGTVMKDPTVVSDNGNEDEMSDEEFAKEMKGMSTQFFRKIIKRLDKELDKMDAEDTQKDTTTKDKKQS